MSEAPATLNLHKLADKEPYVNGLVYGESGVGKTVFASTAPRPILWLEAEGGTHSIPDVNGIDVATVQSLDTYRETLRFLDANPGLYQTLVVDSLTESSAGLMTEIMDATVRADEARDKYEPQFKEWRRLTEVMREIVRAYRDLPINTVITALQREDVDEMSGRVKVRPRLSPALADEMPGYMDFVGYMYSKGDVIDVKTPEEERDPIQRVMLLRPTIKHVAKLRAPAGSNPPDLLVDPTFDEVAKLVLAPREQ